MATSTIRLVLIEPDDVLRRAEAELFAASAEFEAKAAKRVGEALEAGVDLHHVDVAVLAGSGACEAELDALRRGGFGGPLVVLGGEGALKAQEPVRLERPCRFSALAGAIRGALHGHARSDEARFAIGPYEFHPADRTLVAPEREPVRLTDKEAGILRYLHRAGRPVSREELLGEVWGYNSGVTTHTLETHIYRLRQKMEPGPDDPRLLLTEEGGYRLAEGDTGVEG